METDSDSDTSQKPLNSANQSSTLQATDDRFTPSQRIAELNDIDTSLSTLLSSASTAVGILSNQNVDLPTSETLSRQRFEAAASTYFSTLSAIEVRLRRQVYALEEAGLIQAGDERDARRGRNLNNETGGPSGRRGGYGPLDPSWLNARVSNSVEVQKKKELLAEAKVFVQSLTNTGNNEHNGNKDVNMEGTD